jgi:anti-anti-sigma factor
VAVITGRTQMSAEVPGVAVGWSEGRLAVALSGEVDRSLAGALGDVVELVAEAQVPVDVDLSEVTFFCAHGVTLITQIQAVAAGGDVRIVSPSPCAAMVLDCCRVPWQGTAS